MQPRKCLTAWATGLSRAGCHVREWVSGYGRCPTPGWLGWLPGMILSEVANLLQLWDSVVLTVWHCYWYQVHWKTKATVVSLEQKLWIILNCWTQRALDGPLQLRPKVESKRVCSCWGRQHFYFRQICSFVAQLFRWSQKWLKMDHNPSFWHMDQEVASILPTLGYHWKCDNNPIRIKRVLQFMKSLLLYFSFPSSPQFSKEAWLTLLLQFL